MTEAFGLCALCGDHRLLKNSHFLPQALYRLVRSHDNTRPYVFAATVDGTWKTDKQITKHLLCEACEQMFHKNGEDWILRQVYRGKGVFRLLDTLNTLAPFAQTPMTRAYCVDSVDAIDRVKMSYFAMSVFWRGAITEWSICGRQVDKIDFGSKYTNRVRDYLLGRTAFPEHFSLNVEVCDEASAGAMIILTPSITNRSAGFHSYRFVVPGIAFHLHVGQRLPPEILKGCLARGDRPIIVRIAITQFVSNKQIMNQKTGQEKRPLRLRLRL